MRCPKCRKGTLVVDASLAELYCQRCGAVIEEKRADPKAGLFEFDRDDGQSSRNPGREATSWLYPYKNLGSGRKFRASAVEESFARAHGDFQLLWGQLRLPMHVRVYSALLWRRCYKERLTRGRSTQAMAAATVYAAYMDMHVWRKRGMLARATDVPMGLVDRYYGIVTERLGLKYTGPRIRTMHLIMAAVPIIDQDIAITALAIDKLDDIMKGRGTGKRTVEALAAASIYLAAKEVGMNVTQEAVASATGTSERGLRRVLGA